MWITICECLRRWLSCPREHGLLVLETDALYLHCPHCGFVSPGVMLDTRRIRRAWAFDRMRLRFRRAS
jgi:hypothetical protein